MIQLQMYICSDSENVLNKTLTDGTNVNGDFNGTLNILNPSIRIGGIANIGEYNYCYIPSIQRYYFIDSYVIERACYFVLTLRCDLLMTHRAKIMGLRGRVINSANSNPYYSEYISGYDTRQDIETFDFENNFNENGTIVMLGIKGGVING